MQGAEGEGSGCWGQDRAGNIIHRGLDLSCGGRTLASVHVVAQTWRGGGTEGGGGLHAERGDGGRLATSGDTASSWFIFSRSRHVIVRCLQRCHISSFLCVFVWLL